MGNKIAIAMAVILGVGAVLLVRQYIRKQEAAFKGKSVIVTVARKAMQKGQTVSMKDLGQRAVPEKYWRGSGGVLWEDKGQLIGNPLAYEVRPQQFMTLAMVDTEQSRAEGIVVRNGLRAYSLGVGGVRGVSGLLVLGDRVDILGTFKLTYQGDALGSAMRVKNQTMYLMKDVEIKALDRTTVGAVRNQYSTVTFELSPLECLVLEYAQNVGEVKLVKRNRTDRFDKYDEDERIEVNQNNLMQFIKFAMRNRASKAAKGED